MFWFVWLVLLSNGVLENPSKVPVCPKPGLKPGDFSQVSVYLCFQNEDAESRHLQIPSPDQSVFLVVDGEDAKFYANGHEIRHPILVGRDEEIIWSPDSRALIFTLSLGAAGPVLAGIPFLDEELDSKEPNITKIIKKSFAARHPTDPCWKGANVGGLGWLEGSRKAVLIAEIPPSPQCEDTGGYFNAYVVSLPEGRIVKRYSMKQAIRRWHKLLGQRLRDDIALLKDR
jgi:hypothetical protein